MEETNKMFIGKFQEKRLYKKKYWVFLESADRFFLKKRRNASSI